MADTNSFVIAHSKFKAEEKAALLHEAKRLGIMVDDTFQPSMRCVVAKVMVGSEKCRAAVASSVPVVSLQWLQQSATCHRILPFEEFQLRPLEGCRISLTGFGGSDRSRIQKLCEKLGGHFTKTLDKTCTHLIAAKAEGPKYDFAKSTKMHVVSEEWVLKTEEFGYPPPELDHLIGTFPTFSPKTSQQSSASPIPATTTISPTIPSSSSRPTTTTSLYPHSAMGGVGVGGGPLRSERQIKSGSGSSLSELTSGDRETPNCDREGQREQENEEEEGLSDEEQMLFDGCSAILIGSKIPAEVVRGFKFDGGGSILHPASDRSAFTHVIVGNGTLERAELDFVHSFSDKFRVTSDWIAESIKQKRRLPECEFSWGSVVQPEKCSQQAYAQPPFLHHNSPPHSQLQNHTSSLAENAASGVGLFAPPPPPVSGVSSGVGVGAIKIKTEKVSGGGGGGCQKDPRDLFRGLTFRVFDGFTPSDKSDFETTIASHGGQVLPDTIVITGSGIKSPASSRRCDYIICNHSAQAGDLAKSMSGGGPNSGQCVTVDWLWACSSDLTVHDPHSHIVFTPISRRPIPPRGGGSGGGSTSTLPPPATIQKPYLFYFGHGRDKTWAKQIVLALGGNFEQSENRLRNSKVTHTLCTNDWRDDAEHVKLAGTRKFNVLSMKFSWLVESARAGYFVQEEPHIFYIPGENPRDLVIAASGPNQDRVKFVAESASGSGGSGGGVGGSSDKSKQPTPKPKQDLASLSIHTPIKRQPTSIQPIQTATTTTPRRPATSSSEFVIPPTPAPGPAISPMPSARTRTNNLVIPETPLPAPPPPPPSDSQFSTDLGVSSMASLDTTTPIPPEVFLKRKEPQPPPQQQQPKAEFENSAPPPLINIKPEMNAPEPINEQGNNHNHDNFFDEFSVPEISTGISKAAQAIGAMQTPAKPEKFSDVTNSPIVGESGENGGVIPRSGLLENSEGESAAMAVDQFQISAPAPAAPPLPPPHLTQDVDLDFMNLVDEFMATTDTTSVIGGAAAAAVGGVGGVGLAPPPCDSNNKETSDGEKEGGAQQQQQMAISRRTSRTKRKMLESPDPPPNPSSTTATTPVVGVNRSSSIGGVGSESSAGGGGGSGVSGISGGGENGNVGNFGGGGGSSSVHSSESEHVVIARPPLNKHSPDFTQAESQSIIYDHAAIEAKRAKALSGGPQRPHKIQLSGIQGALKEDLIQKIAELGGEFNSAPTYDHTATHLITSSVGKTEKFLSFVSSGKWILDKSFIEASYAQKKWVSELDHYVPTRPDEPLASAARSWRERGGRAFEGFHVLLCVEKQVLMGFANIFKAGAARVSYLDPALGTFHGDLNTVTHVIFRQSAFEEKRALWSTMDTLAEKGILFLESDFIVAHLSSIGEKKKEMEMAIPWPAIKQKIMEDPAAKRQRT